MCLELGKYRRVSRIKVQYETTKCNARESEFVRRVTNALQTIAAQYRHRIYVV